MGSGSLGQEIDLQVLVEALEDHVEHRIESNFSHDGMVTVRLETKGPAFTIFRTGTLQIRGAQNKQEMKQRESELRSILSEIDFDINGYSFEHKTTIFVHNFDCSIDLEELAISCGLENTEYEPEQFPGLIYDSPSTGATLLAFASGKAVITGTKKKATAEKAIRDLEEHLFGNSTAERCEL
jgi:transcription initiation factor TFIID TATA-box-binding protein